MPVGEVIVEFLLSAVLHAALFWTGFVFLKVITLGGIPLAPLHTMGDENRRKRKWYEMDWSPWLHRPFEGRALKSEYTTLIGLLVWIGLVIGVCVATADKPAPAEQVDETKVEQSATRVRH
jgi:hypothetical protein